MRASRSTWAWPGRASCPCPASAAGTLGGTGRCVVNTERAHAEKAPGAISGKLALPGALAGVGRARGLGTTALAWQPLQGVPRWGCEATQVSS